MLSKRQRGSATNVRDGWTKGNTGKSKEPGNEQVKNKRVTDKEGRKHTKRSEEKREMRGRYIEKLTAPPSEKGQGRATHQQNERKPKNKKDKRRDTQRKWAKHELSAAVERR
jgi:hypothetical protein